MPASAYASHLRHELDGHLPVGVGVLEVVDQLRQVLDGVDVVVRGRRDEAHTGGCVPVLGDVLGDLDAPRVHREDASR